MAHRQIQDSVAKRKSKFFKYISFFVLDKQDFTSSPTEYNSTVFIFPLVFVAIKDFQSLVRKMFSFNVMTVF